jgi:uncharacterized protein YaeQ
LAIKATIFKAELQVADMGRGYYGSHSLTIARHPSETDERMMVRMLAFAIHAHERLEFGKGISTDEEPAVWLKDLTGSIESWIDVGLPDERLLRKASGRAREVDLYLYGGSAADIWWKANAATLERLNNLCVWNLPQAATKALAGLAARSMTLSATIQDGQAWMASNDGSVSVEPVLLKERLSR